MHTYAEEVDAVALRQSRFSNTTLVLLFGLGGAVYAAAAAQWHYPGYLFILPLLLLVIERFPIQTGRITFTFSYPILYTLAVLTGYEATALIGSVLVLLVGLSLRRPWQSIVFNMIFRLLAVLAAGFAVKLLPGIRTDHSVSFEMLKLAVSTTVFTGVATLFVMWHLHRRFQHAFAPTLLKMGLWNIAVSFLYDTLMIWLASDPKNTGSGTLGTLFFFLPLVAITLMMHLFTNLVRAKSGLETLFAVSQSINRQRDLPTVLMQVIGEANRLVRGHCSLLFLVGEDGRLKRVVGTHDDSLADSLQQTQSLAGWVASTGEPILVNDVRRDSRYLFGESDPATRSMLLVPIQTDDLVAGVISLGKKETHAFTAADQKMMTIFATHAGVAIKNALYIEEREKRLLVEERNRLAREIHDGLAQDLASALLEIEMIKRRDPAELERSLENLQGMLRGTASTVRHSIYSLRPAPYSHVGLVPALRAHLDEVGELHGLRTHFQSDLADEQLPPDVAKAIFQVASESVQNAVKHAGAKDLHLSLSTTEDIWQLIVRDNGRGFHFGQAILQAAERRSFGIENLHSIANAVGGTLDFVTAPGAGTEVILEVPRKEAEAYDNTHLAL
jgi:signal transduction histidine kinase